MAMDDDDDVIIDSKPDFSSNRYLPVGSIVWIWGSENDSLLESYHISSYSENTFDDEHTPNRLALVVERHGWDQVTIFTVCLKWH